MTSDPTTRDTALRDAVAEAIAPVLSEKLFYYIDSEEEADLLQPVARAALAAIRDAGFVIVRRDDLHLLVDLAESSGDFGMEDEDRQCRDRVVSILETAYDIAALAPTDAGTKGDGV